MKRIILGSSVLAMSLCASQMAFAQATAAKSGVSDKIEELVVTAEHRKENIQKIPISITAVSGDVLQAKALTTIDAAINTVPGVVLQNSANGSAVFVRGIGSAQDPQLGGAAVSMNIDGIYQASPEVPASAIYDMERVEVLRGPQGTLYGRNATAGSVNIITANPSNKNEFAATLGIGSYNSRHLDAMVNAPINDSVSIRAAVLRETRDGYIHPSGYNDADQTAVRLKALVKPSDKMSLLFGGEYLKVGGVGPGGVGALATHPDDPWYGAAATGRMDVSNTRLYGQLDWDLDFGTLTVLPAHQRFFRYNVNVLFPQNATTAATQQVTEDQDTFEVRLASPASSSLKWLVGAYYLDAVQRNTVTTSRTATPASAANYPFLIGSDVSSTAIFGQATYPVSDSLRFTVGLRSTRDERTSYKVTSATSAQTPYSGTWDSFTYKLGVEADVLESTMVYATLSTGYKAGGIDAGFNSFKPEKLKAFTLGSKSRFLDNKLQFNSEAYYYDYTDFQAQYGYRCQNSVLCNPIVGFYNAVVNAGKATLYGVEVEAVYKLTAVDKLDFSLAYAYSNFDKLVLSAGTSTAPATCAAALNCAMLPDQTLTNEHLANAPEWVGTLGYEHVFQLESGADVTFRMDTRLSGAYWTGYRRPPQVSQELYQGSFHKSNMYLTYHSADGQWAARLFVKNLENEAVVTGGIGSQASGGAVFLQAPRTVGASVSYNF